MIIALALLNAYYPQENPLSSLGLRRPEELLSSPTTIKSQRLGVKQPNGHP
jgi:hypothetical protein